MAPRDGAMAAPLPAPVVATPLMAHYCFHVLECHLRGLPAQPAPEAIRSESAPVFTGWYNAGHLRGCIGSLVPYPLADNLRDRALDAALHDKRFAAVQLPEVPDLTCSVNVLHSFEDAADPHDWAIGTHGLTIEFGQPQGGGRPYRATFLPSVMVKCKMSHDDAIRELVRKAGFPGPVTPPLLQSMQVTRFQSSEVESGYGPYLAHYSALKQPRPNIIAPKPPKKAKGASHGSPHPPKEVANGGSSEPPPAPCG